MAHKPRLGFAMCGSFCTFKKAISALELLSVEYDILPIMSETAYSTDTRFGEAENFRKEIEGITGKRIIHTVYGAEPIGPKKQLDILLISPCTGNTMAKIANSITDTSVTLAAKAHLRNERPLVIAPATNDGLSGSAKNIGILLDKKNVYFVPFGEDDPITKPRSLVTDFSLINDAVKLALVGKQVQPIIK